MGGDVLVLPAANRFTVHFEAVPVAATAGSASSKRHGRHQNRKPGGPWLTHICAMGTGRPGTARFAGQRSDAVHGTLAAPT